MTTGKTNGLDGPIKGLSNSKFKCRYPGRAGVLSVVNIVLLIVLSFVYLKLFKKKG